MAAENKGGEEREASTPEFSPSPGIAHPVLCPIYSPVHSPVCLTSAIVSASSSSSFFNLYAQGLVCDNILSIALKFVEFGCLLVFSCIHPCE